jgi:hypothetical protein
MEGSESEKRGSDDEADEDALPSWKKELEREKEKARRRKGEGSASEDEDEGSKTLYIQRFTKQVTSCTVYCKQVVLHRWVSALDLLYQI